MPSKKDFLVERTSKGKETSMRFEDVFTDVPELLHPRLTIKALTLLIVKLEKKGIIDEGDIDDILLEVNPL